MQTLKFSILINAAVEKVWNCLWDSENYQQWAGVISVGSHYKTEQFAEGKKIQFLTPTRGGTQSIIEKIDPYKLLVFRHIGEITDFEEQTLNPATHTGRHTMESYELKDNAAGTELTVHVDTVDASVEFMKNSFPFALQVVKKMAEDH